LVPSSTATCTVSSQRRGHLGGRLLGLAHEVEPVGELAAELEQAHAEPVAGGRAVHRLQVATVGERGDQFVHGGTRQSELVGDLRRGQRRLVQEQLEYVQCATHRGHRSTHDPPFPPSLTRRIHRG
jgi:hypothetical protein